MATIEFANGMKVEFEGSPTPQDVEEVLQQITGGQKSQNVQRPAPISTSQVNTVAPEPPPPQSFSTRVGNAVQKRIANIDQAKARALKGGQTHAEGVIQSAGQVAGLIGDIGAEATRSAFKTVTPQPVQQKLTAGAQTALETPLGQAGIRAAFSGFEAYNDWKKRNPRAAANLEATINIASVIPAAKGAQVTTRGAKSAAKGAARTVEFGVESAARPIERAVRRSVAPLDDAVKTVIDPRGRVPKNVPLAPEKVAATAEQKMTKLNSYIKQAKKAAADPRQATPLELAGKRAEDALKNLSQKLNRAGELQKTSLKKEGGKVIGDVEDIQRQFLKDLREQTGMTYVKGEFKQLIGRVAKVTDASDRKLLRDALHLIVKVKPTSNLRQVDDTIDALQGMLFKRSQPGAIPLDSSVERLLKQTTRQLNKRLRQQGGRTYRKANDRYAAFVDVRNQLSKSLGYEGSKGGSLMKAVFSPTDRGTKAMFEKIRKITGIDLTEDATLAKLVMESVGDTRQRSLLEQLELLRPPTGPGGAVRMAGKLVQALPPVRRAQERMLDPLEAAREFIQDSAKWSLPRSRNAERGFIDFSAPVGRSVGNIDREVRVDRLYKALQSPDIARLGIDATTESEKIVKAIEKKGGKVSADLLNRGDELIQLLSKRVERTISPADYGMSHRPSKTSPAYNLAKDGAIPDDIYTHPHYYANMRDQTYQESFSALKKIRNNPEATVTIYRAGPKKQLNKGDWVTLSKKYAEQEAQTENVPVHAFKVKAKDVWFAGDDLNEFGYYPARSEKTNVSRSLR